MDGLTTVLTCEAAVTKNAPNRMKLAIADAKDSSFDSAVFLGAGTLLSTPRLTVNKTGNGLGTVTSAPAGITCGTTCSTTVTTGTTVTLTATQAPGSTFTGWSGGGCSGTGPCTLTLTADTTVTASFANARVLAWGSDLNGRLGDGGTNTDQPTPVPVSGMGPGSDRVVDVAAGRHSLALRADGAVLAWGTTATDSWATAVPTPTSPPRCR